MQLQQQLAQLAAAAYPAFHGVPVIPQSLPTAKVMPAGPGAAHEAQRAAAPGTSGVEAMTAMDPALVAGNSFVAALQAQLAVSRALSQVKSVWDPPQAVPYAGQRAPTPAELVAAAPPRRRRGDDSAFVGFFFARSRAEAKANLNERAIAKTPVPFLACTTTSSP